MKSVFAPPGAFIPGKAITLGVGKIRDVESRGMLVSEAELQISDDHDGIIDLPDDAPVGAPYAKYAGLDDPVIEINLTPNRGDATGVHGIARDLAAADMGKFKDPAIKPVKGEFPCPVQVTLDFGATPSLCPAFALRLVRGVKNGPSPDWLQKRLIAIGLRPINALVDITNFITYDRGRPLHVFDAAKVRGNLAVRRAQPGESVLALDGKTYTLDDTMCVIADDDGVESLAGIMGGEKTGCSETTTDVLIESALWEPMNIAQTGRKLGINSDARYRFERGVDPAFMRPGLELATRMVMDLCGGTPSEIVVAGSAEPPERVIDFPQSELKRLAGLDVPLTEVAPRARAPRLLRRRAKRAREDRGAVVAARRAKARPISSRRWCASSASTACRRRRFRAARRRASRCSPPIQLRTRKAKRALAARNLVEAVTWSFIAKKHGRTVRRRQAGAGARQSDRGGSVRHAAEPHSRARCRRAEKRRSRLSRYRLCSKSGRCFAAISRPINSPPPPASGARWQSPPASAGIGASATARSMPSTPRPMRSASSPRPARRRRRCKWCRAGRPGSTPDVAARSRSGRRTCSAISANCIRARSKRSMPKARWSASRLSSSASPSRRAKATRAKPALELSPFQPVERDFAFVVDRNVKAADIVRAAQSADRKLIAGVSVFDLYEGKGIEPGKKSIAIAVTLQPRDKTMTDAEIEALAAKIVAEVSKRTGGVLRA